MSQIIWEGTALKMDVPVSEMTVEIMQRLEDLGLIIRICPSHHRFDIPAGDGAGRDVYVSEPEAGSHKLLSVVIDRTEFSAFGFHNANEEFLLLGGIQEKPMYLMIALCGREQLEEKIASGTLSPADFVCLHCKFNDPNVSFFTMKKGIVHGEACADAEGLPASFYVTEPSGTTLCCLDMKGYALRAKQCR